MMIRSHMLIGLTTWVGCGLATGQNPVEPYQLILALIGSALPDIDHPGSWLGSRTLPLSAPIWLVFGHRTFTHSLLPIILMSAFIYAMPEHQFWALPLAIGYASHLAADFFSDGGIPLFYPIKRRFRFPVTVTTGGFSELLVVTVAISVFALTLYSVYGLEGLLEIGYGEEIQ